MKQKKMYIQIEIHEQILNLVEPDFDIHFFLITVKCSIPVFEKVKKVESKVESKPELNTLKIDSKLAQKMVNSNSFGKNILLNTENISLKLSSSFSFDEQKDWPSTKDAEYKKEIQTLKVKLEKSEKKLLKEK